MDVGGVIPEQYEHTVVAGEVPCRQCGYDLRRLPATGTCPECGADVWPSVLDFVDQQAARMPHLTNPRAVGNAMVALAAILFIASAFAAAYPLLRAADRYLGLRADRALSSWLPDSPAAWMAGFTLLAIAAVIWLSPPFRVRWSAPVRVGVWLVAAGVALAGTTTALWLGGTRSGWLYLGWLGAIAIFLGLREIFDVIGQRSREYRGAETSRQGLGAMIAAVVGATLGEALRVIGTFSPQLEWLRPIGLMIRWACILMALIGLVYLVANAWWVRRALRNPRPWLGKILLPDLPSDTTILTDDADDDHFDVRAKGE